MFARYRVKIGLILLIVLLIGFSLVITAVRRRQAYRQLAAGSVFYANPGDNLAQKVNSLSPGDTLFLNDGIYANSQVLVQNKHGTSAAHISIGAVHDGKAIIDGNANPNYPDIILVDNSTYIDIYGLVARNSAGGVVAVVNPSSFVTIKRITAYNAGKGNFHVFSTEPWGNGDPSNVLFEDDAGWGNGRYIYSAYHATNITFRRCFAYWTSQSNFSPAPRAPFNVYGATNVLLENDIGMHGIPDQNSTDYFTSDWQTTDGPPQDNATYLGIMFFDNWEGLWVNGSAGNNTVIKNSYFENTRKQGSFTTNRNHGDAIMWGTNNGTGGSVDTSTFVNNEVGFSKQTSQNPTLTNSVFLNNVTAITGGQNHSYSDFFGNGTLGTALSATDKQADPGYNVAKYGKGAYLFVPQGSPLKGAGSGGGDIGANIIYEYVNGQLTNQPLWPWPMEDRIRAETAQSVTWANAGGFWNTLDGVYPNVSITPPSGTPIPTPTPTQGVTITQPPCTTSTPAPTNTPTPTSPAGFCGKACHSDSDCDTSGATCGACDPDTFLCTAGTVSVTPTPAQTATPTQPFSSETPIPTSSTTPSPTSGSSLTPTPTGPAVGTLSLHFEGVDSQNNPYPHHPQKSVIISLFSSQDFTKKPAAILTEIVTFSLSDPNGAFVNSNVDLSSVSNGSYFVLAKSQEGSLQESLNNSQPVSISKGRTVSLNGTQTSNMRMGDLNNDNNVGAADYNILVDCFGAKQTSPACKQHKGADQFLPNFADFNDDGIVNGIDYNILIRNFGDQGFGTVPSASTPLSSSFNVNLAPCASPT